ncbi:MAG: pyruvate, phosphate dikinase [Alphaproteobacteria bacterium]
MTQNVYIFTNGKADGQAGMKELLGGKGANLAEMTNIGLPVPPGFTITTEVCTYYNAKKTLKSYPKTLVAEVEKAIAAIEKGVDAGFNDPKNPLLLSVRSGAKISMPGMMDTVLNLGLNDITVKGLIENSENPRFAYDSYRRFIQMYSNVVLEIDHYEFEKILENKKEEKDVYDDVELTAEDLQELIVEYKALVEKELGKPFPQDTKEQLWGAIGAVFDSWMNERAIVYRRLNNIPESIGTAVTVQAMVFGNMGEDSATGVAFTRNPSTGENTFYGEYLINAQGEDVVAGIRTPQSLTILGKQENDSELPAMEEVMPAVFKQLAKMRTILEKHYKDMQDIEFTVQKGKLFILQTRSGKRTAAAAVRIAVEMVDEKLIDTNTAVLRVDAKSLDQLLHPTLDPNAQKRIIARGLPASPGAASGKVVFSAEDVEILTAKGEAAILTRIETSPEDITGMHLAKGILTARGGMTSHAAVVARGMGRSCVSGAGELKINYKNNEMHVNGQVIKQGDIITLDGSTGEVMLGEVPTIEPKLSGDFSKIMTWADKVRRMKVRTNAETALDAATAIKFGAEGIGLCRTEHMFFEADRITAMRQMILSDDEEGRRAALDKLLPMQREDFKQLFTIMKGLPVTVRLLDPPLHEFLPHNESEVEDVAKAAGVSAAVVRQQMSALHESNPMLGHRGCRLAVSYPEICEMQSRAIFEAAIAIKKETGEVVIPEVMVPLISTHQELEIIKIMIDETAEKVKKEQGASDFEYLVGTMIELPRAAIEAGDIAKSAQFFSFGTNDLTQTTFGLSRDDTAGLLQTYEEKGILEQDPFMSIDQKGVGFLVKHAVRCGRDARADIKLGVCGEHGGDPDSILFFEKIGLDYVSCSPYRVPIARLVAAQATLLGGE